MDDLVREHARHRAFALANNIDLLDIDALLAVITKRSAEPQNGRARTQDGWTALLGMRQLSALQHQNRNA